MMPATQKLLNTINACSSIVLAQIPAACERIANDTAEAILRLPLEKSRLELMQQPVSGSAILEDSARIFAAVTAYYANIMASSNSHQSELGDNQYAAASANEWRGCAGRLLYAMVLGFEKIPEAKSVYVESLKLFNLHIVENPASYKASFRISETRELTSKIQAHEPRYIKPVKNHGFVWLAIAGVVGMFLTLPGGLSSIARFAPFSPGMLPLLETIALAVCILTLWKGWKIPAMIAGCVPAACRVISAASSWNPVSGLAYMQPVYSHLLGEYSGLLQGFTVLLSFALALILGLYVLGLVKTDFKNAIVTVPFCLFFCMAVVMGCVPMLDRNSGDVWQYVHLLCAACAATGLVVSFNPASDWRW